MPPAGVPGARSRAIALFHFCVIELEFYIINFFLNYFLEQNSLKIKTQFSCVVEDIVISRCFISCHFNFSFMFFNFTLD